VEKDGEWLHELAMKFAIKELSMQSINARLVFNCPEKKNIAI